MSFKTKYNVSVYRNIGPTYYKPGDKKIQLVIGEDGLLNKRKEFDQLGNSVFKLLETKIGVTKLGLEDTVSGYEYSDVLDFSKRDLLISLFGIKRTNFLLEEDVYSLLDPEKMKIYFGENLSKEGTVPFLLLCKEPSLYKDQIAYWGSQANNTPEIEELLNTLAENKIHPSFKTAESSNNLHHHFNNKDVAEILRGIADKLENKELEETDTCIVMLGSGDSVECWKMSSSNNPFLSMVGALETTKHSILNESRTKK